MTEKAEKLYAKMAMLGFFALVGAYYFTGQILPDISSKNTFWIFLRALLSPFLMDDYSHFNYLVI